jgi:hypothetical protein
VETADTVTRRRGDAVRVIEESDVRMSRRSLAPNRNYHYDLTMSNTSDCQTFGTFCKHYKKTGGGTSIADCGFKIQIQDSGRRNWAGAGRGLDAESRLRPQWFFNAIVVGKLDNE